MLIFQGLKNINIWCFKRSAHFCTWNHKLHFIWPCRWIVTAHRWTVREPATWESGQQHRARLVIDMRSLGGAVAQNSNRINFVPRITSKHEGSHFWIHHSTSLFDNLSITGNISLPLSCSSSPSLHANSLMLIWQVGLHQKTLPSARPNEAAFLKQKLDLYLVAVWYVSATYYIGWKTVRQAERQRERE